MKVRDMLDNEMDSENYGIGELIIHNGRLSADMWYPRIADGPHRIREVEVGLSDVRAADSILISYDFDRDGYVIKQASTFSGDEPDYDEDWQEVAFVQAWAREQPDEMVGKARGE